MKTYLIGITVILLLVGLIIIQPVLSDDGIVAYWDFNQVDNDMVEDVSGNGHDGTLVGDVEYTEEGKFGGALVFNGVDSEVDIPFHADLNSETFTVMAWVNVSTDGNGHRAVVSARMDTPQRGYIIYAVPNNTWQYWIGAGEEHKWKSVSGPAITLDEWEHIAGVYSDGSHKLYVNGELVGEQNFDISLNTEEELLIGAGANERAEHNYYFMGSIDEVSIHNRVLSEDEINASMAQDSLLDVKPSDKLTITWAEIKQKQ